MTVRMWSLDNRQEIRFFQYEYLDLVRPGELKSNVAFEDLVFQSTQGGGHGSRASEGNNCVSLQHTTENNMKGLESNCFFALKFFTLHGKCQFYFQQSQRLSKPHFTLKLLSPSADVPRKENLGLRYLLYTWRIGVGVCSECSQHVGLVLQSWC